jgi:AcrR family transcriptional regulator
MTDEITEEKIKNAARTIFTQKGYASARMRDIATLAGVNLALVNYYFRSKENIFKIIMREKLFKIFGMIFPYMQDETTSLEEKITKISEIYIDMLLEDPNLPIFVFGEIQKDPANFTSLLPINSANIKEISIAKQFMECDTGISPVHFMMNFLGMTIFPFIAMPLLVGIKVESPENLKLLIQERKKMIPVWMKNMFNSEYYKK